MVSLTFYDGTQGIGGNKILLEENGKGIFLDFGKNFGRYGTYYEEFLKNRDSRGIYDLLNLGLIPKLNIYRQDLITSDLDMSRYPTPNISAVLLSHAHQDHSGNIGLLDLSIPVVASPLSLAVMKAMQDVGTSSADTDAYYVSPKVPTDHSGLILKSESKLPYTCRKSFCTTSPGDTLLDFLSHRPGQGGKNTKPYDSAECLCLEQGAIPFVVTSYVVDHSIFGSTAYILAADQTIAYTGDFRLHGKLGDRTRDFFNHAKNATVLITEGTRAGRDTGPEGEDGSGACTSEQGVYETCRAASEDVKGLVIADFSPRNFERLETFTRIAHETGRTLVVLAKDLYLLHALECADGTCRLSSLAVYEELVEGSGRKWEKEVVVPRAGANYVSHQELHENPEQYLVCFSFFDMKNLLDINPSGGVYIYSSCEAFSEEMEIDFIRLWQWLLRFNLEPKGFAIGEDNKPIFNPEYHASGHATRAALTEMITKADPDILIPVHTTEPGWFAEMFDGVRIVQDGDRIDL